MSTDNIYYRGTGRALSQGPKIPDLLDTIDLLPWSLSSEPSEAVILSWWSSSTHLRSCPGGPVAPAILSQWSSSPVPFCPGGPVGGPIALESHKKGQNMGGKFSRKKQQQLTNVLERDYISLDRFLLNMNLIF